MRKSDKIAVHKVFETVDRNIEKLRPEEKKVSISAGGLIQGKRFRWKFKPLPILEVAEKTMGYTFLSDNQKRVLIELFGDDPEIFPTDWNQAILRIGQRGGKNTVVEVMVNYICQILISVENVYEYLGYFAKKTVPVTHDIEITNNSMVGESQAKDVFFNRMKMIFKTSVIPGTNDKIYPRFSGLRVGETGEKDIKSKVITFPKFFKDSGALKLYSLDSGITTFEGKNILLSLVDEPSRAHTQATYLNAKLLWEGLTSNVNNTYPNMVGKTLAFSYLNNSEYDLTNELAEQELSRRERAKEKGEERKPYRKVFTYSTFEFNPSTKKTDLMIKEKYEDNIDDARARFECIKSRTQFAFMNPYVNKVKECIIPGLQNRVEYGSKIITKKYKTGKIEKLTAIEIFQVKPDERFRIWASDTSINKDRFILGSGYVEDFERSYTPDISINLANYKVICDLILKWEPTKEHPVDYENVQKVFDHMLDVFPNSLKYVSDVYQAKGLEAIAQQRGIETELLAFNMSFQFKFYTLLRGAISNGLVGYIDEPLLVQEIERLQREGESKVNHPRGFSKDIADMLLLLYRTGSTFEFSQVGELGGLDRFKDGKIIDLIDKMARIENEKPNLNKDELRDYICEVMHIDSDRYKQLRELEEVFFPSLEKTRNL